jgi:hypothetical protein
MVRSLTYIILYINIINKNMQALLDASKEVGLEVNENTNYMFMSC